MYKKNNLPRHVSSPLELCCYCCWPTLTVNCHRLVVAFVGCHGPALALVSLLGSGKVCSYY